MSDQPVDYSKASLLTGQVRDIHLTLPPPDGRVTLVAPQTTRTEVARAYAISKLGWIRQQRKFVTRESHHLWGRRYLMTVIEVDVKPHVKLDHRRIILGFGPALLSQKRARSSTTGKKAQLHAELPGLIAKWEPKLGLRSIATTCNA